MARSYVASSSNRDAWTGNTPQLPMTLFCWFNRQDDPMSGNMCLISVGASGGNSAIRLETESAGNVLARSTNTGNTTSTATSSGATFARNEWHTAHGTFASTTSRIAHLDGANKATVTTTNTIGTLNRIGFAHVTNLSIANHYTGWMAEAAIWTTNLSDDEHALLALGVCPLDIQPDYITLYAPMVGDAAGSAKCWLRGPATTTNGSPGIADHPGQAYPWQELDFESQFTAPVKDSFSVTNPATVGVAASGDVTASGDVDYITLAWGDATTSTVTSGVTANHTYGTPATVTATVSVVGLDGTTDTGTQAVTVVAAATLTIDQFSALPSAVGIDDNVAANWVITGTPTLALLNWGDTTTNTVTGSTTDDHAYTAVGTYTPTLTISDASENDSATASPVVVTVATPEDPDLFPAQIFPGSLDIEPDVFPEVA